MEANFPNAAMPYLCSSLASISLAAKVALAPFSQNLEDESDIINLLRMPESIVSELESSPSITVEIFSLQITQLDILLFVKLLLGHDNSIISRLSNVLDSISSIVQQGSDFLLEKKAAIDLLWKLVYLGCSLEIISHPDLMAQLLSLTGQEEESLQRMASCVLWKLDSDQQGITHAFFNILKSHTPMTYLPIMHAYYLHADMPEFYIEECYLNGYYNECVSECESFLKTSSLNESSELRTAVMLTQGKALFHIYCTEQEILRKQHVPKNLTRHSACYSNTKLAINLLGSLLDKDLLNDEGSRILDLCMIDYIHQTNQSCQRCLLCRKKGKLKKSHIWPKAILEDFSSGVEMPDSRRVLLVSWQSQNKYLTPKEVTFYMFCESCEGLLSRHGETQFVPKFFRQIYDVSVTEKPQSAFSIEYGNWLYEFCVGIIFRGIAQRNMLKFVNSEEIYEVLTLCRSFLLECSSDISDSALKVRELDICIMISPTEAKGKDTESGFINRVLNMPALYGVEEIQP